MATGHRPRGHGAAGAARTRLADGRRSGDFRLARLAGLAGPTAAGSLAADPAGLRRQRRRDVPVPHPVRPESRRRPVDPLSRPEATGGTHGARRPGHRVPRLFSGPGPVLLFAGDSRRHRHGIRHARGDGHAAQPGRSPVAAQGPATSGRDDAVAGYPLHAAVVRALSPRPGTALGTAQGCQQRPHRTFRNHGARRHQPAFPVRCHRLSRPLSGGDGPAGAPAALLARPGVERV